MMNTVKALSKQFFGAKYESVRKSLLAAAFLFIAVYAAEFRVVIAPFILYLTSTFFTAGIMWQVLTGRRHMETMQGMFMLPFDNRSLVFSYVLVLGAHTLITKTLLIWALFFAVASWSVWEIVVAITCGCMACAVTAAGYRMCRKGHIALWRKFLFVYAYHFLNHPFKNSPQHLEFPECWGKSFSSSSVLPRDHPLCAPWRSSLPAPWPVLFDLHDSAGSLRLLRRCPHAVPTWPAGG